MAVIDRTITLFTLNIWKGGTGRFKTEPKTKEKVRQVLEAIIQKIANQQVDIIALQEVDRNCKRSYGFNGDEMMRSHLGSGWKLQFSSAFPLPPHQGQAEGLFGNSILTKLEAGDCLTPKLNNVVEGQESRSAVCLPITVEGIAFEIINLHLGLKKEDQINQLTQLISLINRVSHASHIILCGDLNVREADGENALRLSYTQMMSLLNSSNRQFEDLGPRHGITHGSGQDTRKIDYILYSRGTVGQISVATEIIECRDISDHNGIKLRITLPRAQ